MQDMVRAWLDAHAKQAQKHLQRLRARTLWWLYPEVPDEIQFSFVSVHLHDLEREIQTGPVSFHPFMDDRGGLVARYKTLEDARRGLEQGRRGLRASLARMGLCRMTRSALVSTLTTLYRDKRHREALQDLYERFVARRPTAVNYEQAIEEWMRYSLTATDEDLRQIGKRLLAAFAHRVRAEKEVEDQQRYARRRLRETRRLEEEKQRKEREAAERELRERERARRESELRENARRRQAEDTVGSLARQAGRRYEAVAAVLENLERLPKAPYADLKSRLLRQRVALATLRDLVISESVTTRRLELVAQNSAEELQPVPPHLVGTLARRLVIRVPECGQYRNESILEMASMLAESGEAESLYGKLCASVKGDRVLCLSYQCCGAPWQSVYAELAFERASNPEHLNIIVSVHVPFGEGTDSTPYPTEESTNYVRPSQTLTLVPKLVVNAGNSNQHQDEDSEEWGSSTNETERRSQQSGRTLRTGQEHRVSNSYSEGRRNEAQFPFPPGKPSLFGKTEYSQSESQEQSRSYNSSDERTWSTEHEHSSGSERSKSDRHRVSHMQQFQQEARVEFTPTAIGIDYTDPGRLLAPWRANPKNAFGGKIFDLLCHDLPGLAEILPEAVFERRRDSRHLRDSPGNDLGRDEVFFAEISRWVLVERPGVTPERKLVACDGTARPIDTAVVRELVRHMRPELEDLSDKVLRLPPGQQRLE